MYSISDQLGYITHSRGVCTHDRLEEKSSHHWYSQTGSHPGQRHLSILNLSNAKSNSSESDMFKGWGHIIHNSEWVRNCLWFAFIVNRQPVRSLTARPPWIHLRFNISGLEQLVTVDSADERSMDDKCRENKKKENKVVIHREGVHDGVLKKRSST